MTHYLSRHRLPVRRMHPFASKAAVWALRASSVVTMASLVLVPLLTVASGTLRAETCPTDALGDTVDRIGASLRQLDRKSSDVFRPKLEELAKTKKMTMPVAESWAWQNLSDPRITDYDHKIDSLVGDIDRLSDPKDATQNCTAIEKLTRAEKQLISLMEQRSDYVLEELDRHIESTRTKSQKVAQAPAKSSPKKMAANKPKPAAKLKPVTQPKPRPEPRAKPTTPEKAKAASEPKRNTAWKSEVATAPEAESQLPIIEVAPPLRTTFSASDISQAGSGLFGNVSSHLAAAINGAFAKFGQPNAYVIGEEGGGAFLAGLRYGKGHVHFADGTRQRIYWNGPSFGYDVGADGSRVMFLIYNLKARDQLFIRYPGIEGAAYLAGGIGVTVLGRGGTTIVPIRSGVGLRFGASLSYLRFSPTRRWNPF